MKKVLLGLSGGVDSAVAAYLLKEAGYDVTCCFMRNWDSFANNDFLGNPTVNNVVCPQEEDYQDAVKVAELLGLSMQRVDFIKEYWDYVFSSFLKEYAAGRTPNPDILCNKYIKFDAFFQYGMKQGFDYIATGHYARVLNDGTVHLLRGDDENKDQSYFLCQLPKEALAKTLFPIGDITKDKVREIAEKLQLNVAKKKDSTGICFIGERNFKEFLKNYLPAKKGDIYDINTMEKIDEHEGVLYYTIGQRKGLGIGGNKGPWFVVGKNVEKNRLYVSNIESKLFLYSDSCLVKDVYWINDDKPVLSAKFRYRQKDNEVRVERISETECMVYFENEISSVTPGQYAVFYHGEECLGGGIIDDVYLEKQSIQALIKSRESNYDGKN